MEDLDSIFSFSACRTKSKVWWISGRLHRGTHLGTCERGGLWRHSQGSISLGAQIDSSGCTACTESFKVVYDWRSGEILFAIPARFGGFGLFFDFANSHWIHKAFSGFAWRSAADILEQSFGQERSRCEVTLLSWNAWVRHWQVDQIGRIQCQWRNSLGPLGRVVCEGSFEAWIARAVCSRGFQWYGTKGSGPTRGDFEVDVPTHTLSHNEETLFHRQSEKVFGPRWKWSYHRLLFTWSRFRWIVD